MAKKKNAANTNDTTEPLSEALHPATEGGVDAVATDVPNEAADPIVAADAREIGTVAVDEAPMPESTNPSSKKKSKKPASNEINMPPGATIGQAFEGYLLSLENQGKSSGTCFSYQLELQMAGEEFGLSTPLADLTSARVLEFFISDRVMKTRTGREKAKPTIDKTRRVVRQALVYAQGARLIEKAPLPEETATY